MPREKSNTVKPKVSFAKLYAELEQITRYFEREDVDLEEGLAKFERGMAIANELRERLASAEVKIEEVRKRFGDRKGDDA